MTCAQIMETAICRIATWNAGTFNNMGANEAAELIRKHRIDILCVQETRMTRYNRVSYDAVFKKTGYELYPGQFDEDSEGKPYGGVAVISKWHVCETALPRTAEDEAHPIPGLDKRYQAIKVHRPGNDPFLLTTCGCSQETMHGPVRRRPASWRDRWLLGVRFST